MQERKRPGGLEGSLGVRDGGEWFIACGDSGAMRVPGLASGYQNRTQSTRCAFRRPAYRDDCFNVDGRH